MGDRTPGLGLAVLAGVFGICCGVPLLATLGLLGFLAGVSMSGWTLVGLGAAVAVLGIWRIRTRREGSP